MSAPRQQPRGGIALMNAQIHGVAASIRIGHLDRMPRCKRCGRAICHHGDAEFLGLFGDHESSATRDAMPSQAAENGCADVGRA